MGTCVTIKYGVDILGWWTKRGPIKSQTLFVENLFFGGGGISNLKLYYKDIMGTSLMNMRGNCAISLVGSSPVVIVVDVVPIS